MASLSPAKSNNMNVSLSSMAANSSMPAMQPITFDAPKTNLRGINKPKCIQCGNVARSRCPFQCCKSCCSKAQNPCYIHVLKTNGTLPDKPSHSSIPTAEQPSSDVPSTGISWRLSSLRQLSTNFVNILRSRKPLTQKEAVKINKWRFSRLREYIQGNLAAENEAFDRYLQNVNLLEETLSVPEESKSDDTTNMSEDRFQQLVSEIKLKLESNSEHTDAFRVRTQHLVDEKLKKLRGREFLDGDTLLCSDEVAMGSDAKRVKTQNSKAERSQSVSNLVDKLNKVRNEDDLQSCIEMKFQLFHQDESENAYTPQDPSVGNPSVGKSDLDGTQASSNLLGSRFVSIHQINQDMLLDINEEFFSHHQIAEL